MTLAGFAAHRDPEQSEINAILALFLRYWRRWTGANPTGWGWVVS